MSVPRIFREQILPVSGKSLIVRHPVLYAACGVRHNGLNVR
jgi:hypothetical protein